MEEREQYVKPELEELGRLRDLTGLFDLGDVVSDLLGGKSKPTGGGGKPRGGSH
jgi:hypothetical protein